MCYHWYAHTEKPNGSMHVALARTAETAQKVGQAEIGIRRKCRDGVGHEFARVPDQDGVWQRVISDMVQVLTSCGVC